jgi:RNA polymerase sigma factor (sigma-70 family)
MGAGMLQKTLSRISGWGRGERTTDQELLERFLDGHDEEAFAALMQRHGAMVLGVCERVLRHAHDAEDACQAAFLVLACKAKSVRKHASLASWLHGVALRLARKLQVSLARRTKRETAVAAQKPTACAPGDLSWREVQRLVDEELHALPRRYRAPLVLCYLEGRTQDEAARELGWTQSSVRGQLARAREKLRRRLARRGVTGASAVALAALVPGLSSAAVPLALVTSTAQASVALAAGQPLAATVPASVAALSKEVLQAELWRRLILAALVGLSLLGLTAFPWAMTHVAPQESAQAWTATRRFQVPQAHAWCAAFSHDGKRLAAGLRGPKLDSGEMRMWDARTGEVLYTLEMGHSVRCVAFAPDGKTLATAEHDGMARLRDAADGQVRFLLRGLQGQTDSVAFSAAGKLLATSGWDGTVKLWDTGTGQEVRTLKGHHAQVFAVAFGQGDVLASAGADGTARIWDAATGKLLHTLSGHTDVVHWLAFAPDGKTLATVSWDQTAKLWDAANGKLRATLKGHAQPALAVAFAPDGATLVTTAGRRGMETGPGEMILWDLTARQARARLDLDERAYGTAFSPDGASVATACWDGIVTLWQVPRGQEDAVPPEALHFVQAPAEAQVEQEPPAKEYAEDYHPALQGEGKVVAGLRLFGPEAEECVQFEPAGLRFALPAGYPRERPGTGVVTQFGARGDFEITARYEILQEPRVPGWGNPTRLMLVAVPHDRPEPDVWYRANENRAELARHVAESNQVGQFVADLTKWNPVVPKDPWGNEIFNTIELHNKHQRPATAQAGRLRLVRHGATLYFYTSEEPQDAFTLLSRGQFGTKDLKNVRLLAATGGPPASLDVRVTDLRIRADGFVGESEPVVAPAAPENMWLVLLAAGVPILAGAVALAVWLVARRRRVVAAPVPAVLVFACPACGQRLRALGVRVGSRLKCAKCGQAVKVPASAEVVQ